jgi:signal transduction histidine kinase
MAQQDRSKPAKSLAAPGLIEVVARPDGGEGAATNGAGVHAGGSITTPTERPRWLARVPRLSSRARMARRLLAAGDAERERIEQDIHDGVQAHLTALRIRLAMAAERFNAGGDTEPGAVLARFGDDVERAINELRDLAHGIYPALLSTHGLSAALSSAGFHAAEPITVQAGGVRRCRPEVEIAVYFTCLAALDNAAKYAAPAPVSVSLTDTGDALRFVVEDSGAGFEPEHASHGTGIANMRDRMAAVGGRLTVDSSPQGGTRVQGSVPAPWLDAAAR